LELVTIEQCNGNNGCPNSIINSNNLIKEIEQIVKLEKLEENIQSRIKGPVRQHHTFRISIANCPNACSQVQIKDIGIIAKVKIDINIDKCINCGKCVKTCFERSLTMTDNVLNFNKRKCIGCGMCIKVCKEKVITIANTGFQILAGGKLGRHPMLAVEVSRFTSLEDTIDIIRKIINYYKENSIFGERLGAIFQKKNISEKDIKERLCIE
jgi:anaerobic sulfite reductase subunit C